MEEANKNVTGNQRDSNGPNSWSKTTMEEEIFTHRWIVQTFKTIWETLKEEEELNSSDFQGLTSTHKWHLMLYKRKYPKDLAVCLCLTSAELKPNDDKKLMAKAKFSILDKNNRSVHRLETKFNDFLIRSPKSGGYSLQADDLLNPTKGYIVEDQLRIDCRVTVLKRVNSSTIVSTTIKTTDSLRSMSQDYKNLFESADYHDVIINSGTQEFKAHKAILCARSSVFAAMLKTEMTESVTGKITITDFSDQIIQQMLKFLYCGEIESEDEYKMELFKIADKYNITDLLEECCDIIPSILTSDNAVEVLMAIPEYNPGDLKSKVINFITLNKATVTKTTAFQNMIYADPELFKEVVLAIV